MSKKIIIVFTISLLLIVLVGGYIFYRHQQDYRKYTVSEISNSISNTNTEKASIARKQLQTRISNGELNEKKKVPQSTHPKTEYPTVNAVSYYLEKNEQEFQKGRRMRDEYESVRKYLIGTNLTYPELEKQYVEDLLMENADATPQEIQEAKDSAALTYQLILESSTGHHGLPEEITVNDSIITKDCFAEEDSCFESSIVPNE